MDTAEINGEVCLRFFLPLDNLPGHILYADREIIVDTSLFTRCVTSAAPFTGKVQSCTFQIVKLNCTQSAGRI